ncbi:MAG: SDR family NAD(P)-dependent oxidoreductase, partial [Alphaproteobacteria bacterium]
MRLKNKTAMIVGAGQSQGETVGNGRAVALLFAREGASLACVDRSLEAAEETAALVRAEGGNAIALAADITKEAEIAKAVTDTMAQLG